MPPTQIDQVLAEIEQVLADPLNLEEVYPHLGYSPSPGALALRHQLVQAALRRAWETYPGGYTFQPRPFLVLAQEFLDEHLETLRETARRLRAPRAHAPVDQDESA